MNWMYINPFWHDERLMSSALSPDECRRRLKVAADGEGGIRRLLIRRGDVNFAETGPRAGSLFEMHVGVKVTAAPASGSLLRLRFSEGLVSAIVFCLISAACMLALVWAASSLISSRTWMPGYGAGLLAILVPVLWVLAFRSSASRDEDRLWSFIAAAVDGKSS
jgi:hypothetical protein